MTMAKLKVGATLVTLLGCTSFNLLAQGGLFSDSSYFTDALHATDGGYYTRLHADPGTQLSRYDGGMNPQWANDYAMTSIMNTTIRVSTMDVLPDGGALLVGCDGSYTMSQQSPYDTQHHVAVLRVSADGSIIDAKDHVVVTQSDFGTDQISMDQYMWHPASTGASGEIFISLRRDATYDDYMIMKVDANGDFAWCVRAPSGQLVSSKILADGEGGCFVMLDNTSNYDRIHVAHLGADGSTIWSTNIRRQGYPYITMSRLHRMSDGRLYVVTTSDQNVVRIRMDTTGQVEEYLLVTAFPQPPSNYTTEIIGSAMAEDGSMTMIMDGGNMPYRAMCTDASGAVVSAWTTPETVDGTWTTIFNIGSAQDEGASFTALSGIRREESIFGFHENRSVVISTPLDLSGLCEITPLQFAQTALPLTQLEITEGTPFTPVAHVGTNDIAVTVIPLSLEQPEDFCSFVGSTGVAEKQDEHVLYPNPVPVGGIVRVNAEPGYQVQVVDAMGHSVRLLRVQGAVQDFTADFAPGVYSVLLRNGAGVRSVSRLVVE